MVFNRPMMDTKAGAAAAPGRHQELIIKTDRVNVKFPTDKE
jgi:hypothetical protein